MEFRPDTFAFYRKAADTRPQVGISSCLKGERVRYDGADKQLQLLDELERRLTLLPLCPEVQAKLGVPRPPVQLTQTSEGVRVLGRDDPALDVTDALLQQRSQAYRQLRREALSGYIFKSRSPSCGLASAPVFANSEPTYLDNGLFADGLLRLMPWLARCDETELDSVEKVALFTWQCRLVQEVMFDAADIALPELHERYREQLPVLSEALRLDLEEAAHRGDRELYLQLIWEGLRETRETSREVV